MKNLKKKNLYNKKGQTADFCGVAFVSFNTEKEKNDVMESYSTLSDF